MSAASILASSLERKIVAVSAASLLKYSTANESWQRTYERALQILAANVLVMPRFPGSGLMEGSWQRLQ